MIHLITTETDNFLNDVWFPLLKKFWVEERFVSKPDLELVWTDYNFPSHLITSLEESPTRFVIIDLFPRDWRDVTKENVKFLLVKINQSYLSQFKNFMVFLLAPKPIAWEFSILNYEFLKVFTAIEDLCSHLNSYVNKYDYIESFCKKLPALFEWQAYYYMIIFRRKWLISQHPELEAHFREFFKSDEMKIRDGLLSGWTAFFPGKMLAEWKVLETPYYKMYKKRCWNIQELYDKYPYAFSFLITFEPRNLLKGRNKFFVDLATKIAEGDKDRLRLDKEFIRQVHKARDGNFVLIDVDFDASRWDENFGSKWRRTTELYEKIEPELGKFFSKMESDFLYGCRTPSLGFHLIFIISPRVQQDFFKEQKDFKEKFGAFLEKHGFPVKEIEVKTGQCLTHVPGFNPIVRQLDIFGAL